MALRIWGRLDDLADGIGAVMMLFGFALIIGLLVGITAQHWATDPGSTAYLKSGHSVPKDVRQFGYTSMSDFNSDHQREQATITHLLEAAVGSQSLWENPETGNRGVIWVMNERQVEQGAMRGQICRDLLRHTLLNNAYRNTAGTTCHVLGQAYSAEITWKPE